MTSLREPIPARDRFGEQSRSYARRGETRSAQLAAWTSDIHVLEQLLWENGLGESPDPDAQLAAVGEAVATSLDALAASDLGDVSAQAAVELARSAMMNTFDEAVHELLTERFLSLDHLAALALTGTVGEGGARQRLGDRTPEELVVELLAAAGDCMAVAKELVVEGEHAGAERLARQADVASFEAYLVAAASLAGDQELASADLRWDAAQSLVQPPSSVQSPSSIQRSLPRPTSGQAGDLTESIAARRRQLLALLGSAEQGVLEQTFEPVPEM